MCEMIVYRQSYYLIMLKIINKGLISFQTDCVKENGRYTSTVKYEMF